MLAVKYGSRDPGKKEYRIVGPFNVSQIPQLSIKLCTKHNSHPLLPPSMYYFTSNQFVLTNLLL